MSMPKEPDRDAFIEGLSLAIERFEMLGEQRKQLELEMAKLRQYMSSTLDLLSEQDREAWESVVDYVIENWDSSVSKTLTYAVKKTLQVHFPDWLTAAKVRDQLADGGFDFSSYKSNELASVSTTLRRLKGELETRTTSGATEYRLEPPISPTRPKFGTGLREALKRVGPGVTFDPNKLPSEVAASVYGGSTTDSAQNQPTSHARGVANKRK